MRRLAVAMLVGLGTLAHGFLETQGPEYATLIQVLHLPLDETIGIGRRSCRRATTPAVGSATSTPRQNAATDRPAWSRRSGMLRGARVRARYWRAERARMCR